jgi:methyl-accepting chemotaxis protein
MGFLSNIFNRQDSDDINGRALAAQAFALQSALDVCQANIMMADENMVINYVNHSLKAMLKRNEIELQRHITGFSADTLIGTNVDSFHKNPAHQRRLISNLTDVFKTQLKIGPLTFALIATPVFDHNRVRLGTVVEWQDLTEELAKLAQAAVMNSVNQRMKNALDVCQANVMMADAELNIVYINESLMRMFRINESELRKHLPAFECNKLIGTNIDVFHKNPSHQRGMLAQLKTPFNTKIKVGDLTFDLIATPVFNHEHERIGTVVEWDDMTEELARLQEERTIHNENLRIRDALGNIDTCVMIANETNHIIYMNKAVINMLQAAESDLRKSLPNFSANNLLGQSIDNFHKNPAHQRSLLEKLSSTYTTTIKISNRVFKLTANPVFNDDGVRIGAVVEWKDRTAEVLVEQDIARIVEAAVQGNFAERIDEADKADFVLVLAKGLNELTSTAETALSEINSVLSAVASGDLTERIEGNFAGLFGELKDSCNATAENLARMLGEIRHAAETINTAASEISEGNTDLSSRTEQQASNLEETASSMEELTGTVRQNSDNSRQANVLAAKASEVAVSGGQLIEQVVTTMASINESAQKISDIIGVIDGIAFQTNILALNAAVEAARAGEQGRGFAVVASEVRTLAQRSANAAKDIKALISDSVNKIRNGNDLVDKSGATMKDVVVSIKRVNDIMAEIAAASLEQSTGIDEISKAVNQMDEMTQQNAALVEQAAAAAESLLAQAEQLNDHVAKFKLDDAEEPRVVIKSPKSAVTRQVNMKKPPAIAAPKRPAKSGKPVKALPKAPPGDDEWESF